MFKRICIVTNYPAPYRIPLFNQIASSYDVNLSVFFYAPRLKHRAWKQTSRGWLFDYKEAAKWHFQPANSESSLHFTPQLFKWLIEKHPDVLVVWGFSLQTLLALLYCSFASTPLIVFSEGTPITERNVSPFRSLIRREIIKRAAAFIAASNLAKKNFVDLGAPERSVFVSIQTFDVDSWCKICDALREKKEEIREKRGIPRESVVALYTGSLIKRKGLFQLLEAAAILKREGKAPMFLLVGDGWEKKTLKKMVKKQSLVEFVKFVGFKQPYDLPEWYVLSDFLVFPTLQDTFGLVVNEALAAGLPVICSKWAGAQELIEHGVNGYIVNSLDPYDLAGAIRRLVVDPDLRANMAVQARKSVPLFSLDKAVSGFMQAIEYALSEYQN